MGRSNFMIRHYKNYKEQLETDNKDNQLLKPTKLWAYCLFYGYLLFWGYIFWMEPLTSL